MNKDDRKDYDVNTTTRTKACSEFGSKKRKKPMRSEANTEVPKKKKNIKSKEEDPNARMSKLGVSETDAASLSFEERLRKGAKKYHKRRKSQELNADSDSDDSGDSTGDTVFNPSDLVSHSRNSVKFSKGSVHPRGKVKGRGDSEEDDLDEDDKGDVDDDEPEEDDEYAAVKEEISSLSFEELQQLKEKLGLKVFNQIMHGSRGASDNRQKKVFKRENKNRPREMSSKKPVPRFRETVSTTKKFVNRDPRFDDLSGEFNPHIFEKTYSFIGEVKDREKQVIQKKLKKEKNPEKKQELQYLFNRMKQQEASEQQKQKKSELEKEWKKKEKELVAKEGKTPYYLKKSDLRKLELAEKYKELKKSGKVDKYLSKKRKKTAQKEKRLLPM